MNQSLFIELVEKYFPNLVVQVYEEIVTSNEYTFLRDLNIKNSITGKWETLSGVNKNVMADVISLDASIPLKRAVPLSTATGEIPKVATKRHLNETDLTLLQMLIARDGIDTAQVRKQVFEHVAHVITGQLERFEEMYLSGKSNGGVITVDRNNNAGTEVRVNFGMPADHEEHATIVWGEAGFKPLTDIQKLIDKAEANGQSIDILEMPQATFNLIKNSEEAKNLVYPEASIKPMLNSNALNDLLLNEFGVRVRIVKKKVVKEIDGVQTTIDPWQAGQIIGIPEGKIGTFVWAEVAEMNFPSNLCNYQRAGADNFMLVKKYRLVEPALAEYTASESRALPVIDGNVLYKLDTTATS